MKQYYKHIAFKDWRKYCGKIYDKSLNKKYLHILRSILSWKLLNNHIYPPINFNELLNCVDLSDDIKCEIERLVELTRNELKIDNDLLDKIAKFIEDYFTIMENSKEETTTPKVFLKYDKRFKEIICDA